MAQVIAIKLPPFCVCVGFPTFLGSPTFLTINEYHQRVAPRADNPCAMEGDMQSQMDIPPNSVVIPHADPNRSGTPQSTVPSPAAPQQAVEPTTDVLRNALATLPTDWPVARPWLASREERIQRTELRRAYAWYIQGQQKKHGLPLYPPCTECGHPTGNWCDFCTILPPRAVCSECSDNSMLDMCRCCTTSSAAGM